MIAILVAVLVVVVSILVLAVLTAHSSSVRKDTFSLPATLPTAAITASNPGGCGANRTDFLSFPAHATLYYYVSVNESGDRVNYWTSVGTMTGTKTTVTFGSPSSGNVTLGVTGVTFQFTFQGCGPSPTVPLGFWGNYTLPSSG